MRPCLLLLLALSACPPPPFEETCQRVLVDTSGNMNFGGGPGSNAVDDPPLGTVGSPVTVTLFAPLSSCPSDTLRADATLLDPDNLPLAFTIDPPARVGSAGTVKATLSFTPTKPGLHNLHVAFEPSIGVRSLLVDVVADGLTGATTRVPIPATADCKPTTFWPLTDDTVVCETRSGSVSLSSVDGGTSTFPGEQLVVVDTVLWSINGTAQALERHVFEDGGVRLTHTFPNFPPVATPAMHDLDLALRFRANGRLTLVRLTPAGNTVLEFTLDGSVGSPLAYFAEDGDSIVRWSLVDCPFNLCLNLPDLVAVEPGFLWRAPSLFGEVPGGVRANGYDRPTMQSDLPRFMLPYRIEPAVTPAFAFERMPLWLTVAQGQARVLVSVKDGALNLTAWPRGEVLRVGRHHVLLRDAEAGVVRVTKR